MGSRERGCLRGAPVLITGVMLLVSCHGRDPERTLADVVPIPAHFPSVSFPPENPWSEASWELGRHLFFDTRLSEDGQVSCATCHQPERAFSDTSSVSLGVFGREGFRNTPTLVNLAWQPRFHREGGISSLESQVLAPIQEPHEFNHDINLIAAQLSKDPDYKAWSEQAFQRDLDAFAITRALAAFERSFISGNSPYDQWVLGNEHALSDAELRGMTLFEDHGCSGCHQDLWFTDFETHNNGLYSSYDDVGAYRLTFDSADVGAFKTPSLRNLTFTAPYMFDGSLSTLAEVIDHYNQGGSGHPNQDPRIQPLGLTPSEQNELILFLKALSDPSYIEWAQALDPR